MTPLPVVKSLSSARGPIIAGPCGPKIESQARGREVQDRACGVVVQVDRLAILDENAEEPRTPSNRYAIPTTRFTILAVSGAREPNSKEHRRDCF